MQVIPVFEYRKERFMASKENISQILITTVPVQAKGGIAGLHQVLFSWVKNRDFFFIPFIISSANPFNEFLIKRVLRIINRSYKFYHKLLKERSIRIVHINTSPDAKGILRDSIFIVISRLLKRKIVLQIHGDLSNYNESRIIQWIEGKTFPLCDKILVFSNKDIKKIANLVPKKKLRIFSNGIKVSDFKIKDQSFKNDLSLSRDTRIVLYLSRFVREKGVFELIESIPGVVEECKNVHFVFAGDGPEKDKMEETCKQKNLMEWVTFTGHLPYDKVIKAFACSDIFVLATYYPEGFPVAILQALSAGLPVISCDAGGIADYIEDGTNGFIIEQRNHQVLKEKILLLLKNDELRKRMRNANINLAEREFDKEVILDNLEQLYALI